MYINKILPMVLSYLLICNTSAWGEQTNSENSLNTENTVASTTELWSDFNLLEDDYHSAKTLRLAANKRGDAIAVWAQDKKLWAAVRIHNQAWQQAQVIADKALTPTWRFGYYHSTVKDYGRNSSIVASIDAKGNAIVVYANDYERSLWSISYDATSGWATPHNLVPYDKGIEISKIQLSSTQNNKAILTWDLYKYESNRLWKSNFDFSSGWSNPERVSRWQPSYNYNFLAYFLTGKKHKFSNPTNSKVAINKNGRGLIAWRERVVKGNLAKDKTHIKAKFFDSQPTSLIKPKTWSFINTIYKEGSYDLRLHDIHYAEDDSVLLLFSDGFSKKIFIQKYLPGDGWSTPETIEMTGNTGGLSEIKTAALHIDGNKNLLAYWVVEDKDKYINGGVFELHASAYKQKTGWSPSAIIKKSNSDQFLHTLNTFNNPDGNLVFSWYIEDSVEDQIAYYPLSSNIVVIAFHMSINKKGLPMVLQAVPVDNNRALFTWVQGGDVVSRDLNMNAGATITPYNPQERVKEIQAKVTDSLPLPEGQRKIRFYNSIFITNKKEGYGVYIWKYENELWANYYQRYVGWGESQLLSANIDSYPYSVGPYEALLSNQGHAVIAWKNKEGHTWIRKFLADDGWQKAIRIDDKEKKQWHSFKFSITAEDNIVTVWRSRENNNHLYYQYESNGIWQDPSILTIPDNHRYDRGRLSFGADGNVLIKFVDTKRRYAYSRFKNGQWSEIEAINHSTPPLPKDASIRSIHPDGLGNLALFYNVKIKEINGLTKKYARYVVGVMFYRDGKWSEPKEFTTNENIYSIKRNNIKFDAKGATIIWKQDDEVWSKRYNYHNGWEKTVFIAYNIFNHRFK